MAKRLIIPAAQNAHATEYWCTGKDSNLRTSLGGTDLQSVGFNHSPTCAKLPGDAVVASIRPAAEPTHSQALAANQTFANQVFTNWFSQIRETKNRAYGLPREDHYTPDKVPNGVRWKNLLRRHLLSPAACRNFAAEFVSGPSYPGAGEGI
jgi:hypothetical protein